MDIVLGVSLAPETVRMVLVEGAGAGGVTVDQADFRVPGVTAAAQVIEAILGTTESAAESGYQVRSSGVTWTDQNAAAALRNALAESKIENVMLVSAFVAAAALAQAVGSATHCARTALLFVEPTAATLAVVDTADGSIADVQQKPLPRRDDAALAQLAAMVAGAESMRARPDGVFLVGSGVDIPSIKPALEAATSLSVTAPEEPEMALARGAALASANQQLGAPSTVAMPYVEDPAPALAYSAEADPSPDDYRQYGERRSRKLLAVLGATAILVVGAVALALAIGIRPHADQRPDISKNVVAPATQAAPPPPQAPPPAPSAPPPAPAPVAPNPAPNSNPPQQWPPLPPRDDDHDDHWDWLRRHLGRGILGP
ncbi:hypothetical protein A5787_07570 [Mycobacterium sp. 852002-50816_SCH5313054-b]|uniref:DUF7159 family protein n=1 Tax=Mycobacterium sp. 852002-50816_SCH5313054-b TaxID=1834092 RepID=UPI0007FCB65F|nr:hypothetical protein [Mycobacterium sp. 852002-50816_SCH5313054-b]OBF51238.1 hypothetical protein A5787_07570 [Mycobacterium sp. 852002-50816_SCH5313054-b]